MKTPSLPESLDSCVGGTRAVLDSLDTVLKTLPVDRTPTPEQLLQAHLHMNCARAELTLIVQELATVYQRSV